MKRHVKGHLLAELARKAGVSTNYVKFLINGDRAANTDRARKVLKGADIIEDALTPVSVLHLNKLY